MYEMEGPRSVAQPSTPIAQLPVARLLSAADRATDPDTRLELRFPVLSAVSEVSPGVPGFPPDRYPREVVSAFLLRHRGRAQGLSASNIKILWSSTGQLSLSPAYPVYPPLIHRSVHKRAHSRARPLLKIFNSGGYGLVTAGASCGMPVS
jgi:hypothetical protein